MKIPLATGDRRSRGARLEIDLEVAVVLVLTILLALCLWALPIWALAVLSIAALAGGLVLVGILQCTTVPQHRPHGLGP